MKAFLIGKQVKINACIEKHLAEQYQLNSGKYAEKLKEYQAIGIGFVDGDLHILYEI